MARKTAAKPYWEMSLQELREATKEFDSSKASPRGRPLTKAERAAFERSRQAGVRSIFVKDAKNLPFLTLDPKLVDEAQAYARRKKLTIGQVIERGLRRELAVKD